MSAILHLTDVRVQKGYGNSPQAKFTPGQKNPAYGNLNFKVSNKRWDSKTKENVYDNFSVEWRGVAADSKVQEFISQEGVRVSLYGELRNETFKPADGDEVKFLRVSCEGRNSVQITKFASDGQQSNSQPAAQPATEPSF